MAAEMMIAMPMIAAPMIRPSEMFWSSSISLRIENGADPHQDPEKQAAHQHADKAEDERVDKLPQQDLQNSNPLFSSSIPGVPKM